LREAPPNEMSIVPFCRVFALPQPALLTVSVPVAPPALPPLPPAPPLAPPESEPPDAAPAPPAAADSDVVACHDDTLDQQPDEALPPCKVQLVQSCPQRRRKGRQVVGQLIEPSSVLVLGRDLLDANAHRALLGIEAIAPRLELLDGYRAGLIGVDQPFDVSLELALGALETGTVTATLVLSCAARTPCLNLLQRHLRGLNPRYQRVPYHRIELVATDVLGFAPPVMAAHFGEAASASIIEVLVGHAGPRGLSMALHAPPAFTADDERPEKVVVLEVPRGLPPVLREDRADLGLLLFVNDRRVRNDEPLLLGTEAAGALEVLSVGTRLFRSCRFDRHPTTVGRHATIGGVGQHPIDAALGPPRRPARTYPRRSRGRPPG
jgi:hypothetical protein